MFAKVFGILLFLENNCVCCRIDDLVRYLCFVALRLVVNSKVVNLHPEIQILVALVANWGSRVCRNPRTYMDVSDHARALANIVRTDRINTVRQNKGRSTELFVMIRGHIQALSVDTDVIRVIHVLDRDIQSIKPREKRYRLPINRLTVERFLQ